MSQLYQMHNDKLFDIITNEMEKSNIEYIVTVHCKVCKDIVSLSIPLSFLEAADAVDRFHEEHQHLEKRPNPWEI
jgi:hypothetical protein